MRRVADLAIGVVGLLAFYAYKHVYYPVVDALTFRRKR